jgi:hypothetical protein
LKVFLAFIALSISIGMVPMRCLLPSLTCCTSVRGIV